MLTRATLDRSMHRALVFVGATLLVSALVQWLQLSRSTPPGPFAAMVVGYTAAWGWAVADSAAGRWRGGGLRALALVSLGIGITQWLAGWPSEPLSRTQPPVLLAIAGVAIAGYAWRPLVGVLFGVAGAFLVWRARADGLGESAALLLGGTVLVTGLTPALAVTSARRVADSVEATLARLWGDREALSRDRRRAEEQLRWDGLVHDKVLSALTLAARARTVAERSAASALAGQALAGTSTPAGATPGHLTHDLYRAAAQYGLTVHLRLDHDGSTLPPEVHEALIAAVDQSFANAAQHSGCRSVTLSGAVHQSVAQLAIVDDGRGFDPTTPRPGRMGLDHGIRGRLARVGGSATVDSAPGRGTTVRLSTGPASESDDPEPTVLWGVRGFWPVYFLGAASVGLHILLGLSAHDVMTSTAVFWFCCLLLAVIPLALSALPTARTGWWLVATLAWIGTLALANADLRPTGVVGAGYWFVGISDMTLIVLTLRRGLRWALPAAGAGILAMAAVLTAQEALWPAPFVDAVPQWFAWMAAAAGVRHALNRTARGLAEVEAERGRLAIGQAEAQEVDRVAARRGRQVTQVAGPMLHRIAAGHALAPDERVQARALEATLRDRLVAGPLLSAAFAATVARARDRGVVVVLSAPRTELADAAADASLGRTAVIAVATDLLTAASAGAQVTALWRPDAAGRLGSVTLVGPREASPELAPMPGVEVAVSVDEDSVLVELDLQRVPARV